MNQNQKSIPEKEFKCAIADDQSLVVVTLSGNFCIEHLTEIQSISKQILKLPDIKFVVIDMSRVTDVASNMIFSFAKIQKDVRVKAIQLRIYGTQPKLLKKLLDRGVVRENESCETLSVAVRSLLTVGRRDPIAA